MAKQIIWSRKPASEWAEGYPIGNGRLGGMVLGLPLHDRIALNHDRLWRRYWTGRSYTIQKIFPQVQKLCLEEKWDEVMQLLKPHLPIQGKTVYVNPFVPLADIGIYPFHFGDTEITNYRRCLDMENGIVRVSYEAGGLSYSREYLSSFVEPVMAINIKCSRAARVSGELTLFRIPDRECEIETEASLNELVLKGTFE
jgi:alpha-L-fucosidase 2